MSFASCRRAASTLLSQLAQSVLPVSLGAPLALALLSAVPAPAVAQTAVVGNDFEDGTLQGWSPRGGSVVLANTEEVGSRTGGAGTHSLKTTGRTAGFNGPALNLLGVLLASGATYQVTVAVRLVSGDARNPAHRDGAAHPSAARTVRPRRRERRHRCHRRRLGDAAGPLQLRGRRSRASCSTSRARAPRRPTTSTTSASTLPSRRAAAQYRRPQLDLRDRHHGGMGPRGRAREVGRRHERRRARRQLQPAHHRPQAAFRGAAIQRGRNADVQRLALRRHRVGQAGAGGARRLSCASACSATPAASPPSTPWSGTRPSPPTVGAPAAPPTTSSWPQLAHALRRIRQLRTRLLLHRRLRPQLRAAAGRRARHRLRLTRRWRLLPRRRRGLGTGDLGGEHAFLLKKHFNSMTSEQRHEVGRRRSRPRATSPSPPPTRRSPSRRRTACTCAATRCVWHNQVPAWVFIDRDGTPMTADARRTTTCCCSGCRTTSGRVVGHFGDDVYAWDVVNEVIDESQPDGFRRSPWFNITGTDYIDSAFQVAREVAPDAQLFVNDYSTTTRPSGPSSSA